MKRVFSCAFAVLLVCLLCLPAFAEPSFDTSYTRFNDYAQSVTEDEESELNKKVEAQIESLRMDFPACVFLERNSTTTLSEFGADFYTRNKFGYGEEKSGVLLVLDLKNAKVKILYFGEADTLIGEPTRDAITDSFLADCRDDDVSYFELYSHYYDTVFAAVEEARTNPTTTDPNASPQTDGKPMPAWYPENTEGFTDFHGEDLPPVVDDAHIFTEEQFRELSDKISAMTKRLGIGYAAFTSDDNHGLTPEEYSSDFLHFNGYGVGDGYGAVVFYLSLDPEDRCWLTTSINTYETLFNFDVTYEIDEMVDSSIRGGDYYEAFLMHADYVDALFSNMSENLPDWYPEGTRTYALDRQGRTFAPSPDASKPRVTDGAGMLSAQQMQLCTQTLQTLSRQYGMDLVVFIDSSCRTPKLYQYAEDFYYYNGYAADGICLYIVNRDGFQVGALYYGKAERYGTLGIDRKLSNSIKNGEPASAVEEYVELLTFMLQHDRLPMSWAKRVFCVVVGLFVGWIVGKTVLKRLKKRMTIDSPIGAKSYLLDGSFCVTGRSSSFLYSTVTKTARPKPTESGSSGSSGSSRGGSSYSSGRSAGGSYSSGGRRF
ncbi:MAG: TPM domain-containing protein [Clostridia bacterium]|nr:TPM domain-containing protein [Clostridia bacterium]